MMGRHWSLSAEARKNIGDGHRGIIFTEERKRKISVALKNSKFKIGFQKGHIGYMKGKKMPLETRQKISAALKGRLGISRTPWNKGVPSSPESLVKLKISLEKYWGTHSAWNKGKPNHAARGARHPLWAGGISYKNRLARMRTDYKEWQLAVFKRDNFTCQECGAHNGEGTTTRLHAHHIKSFAKFPECRHIVENGITLCKDCHMHLEQKIKIYKLPNVGVIEA